jgi:hypothetical protein
MTFGQSARQRGWALTTAAMASVPPRRRRRLIIASKDRGKGFKAARHDGISTSSSRGLIAMSYCRITIVNRNQRRVMGA